MLAATVEHGDQNMDLDLITALIAPKTKLADLPVLDSIDTPEADIEAFTMLVEEAPMEQAPETPSFDWPLQLPMAAPEEEAVEPIAEVKVSETIDPDKTTEENSLTAPLVDLKIERPILTKVVPEGKAPAPATDIASPIARHSTDPALPISRTNPQPVAKVETAQPLQPIGHPAATAPAVMAPFVAVAPPPVAEVKQNTVAGIKLVEPPKPAANPELEPLPMRARPIAKASPPLPAPQAPALPAQFSNLEHLPDDPAEVQFSIKIQPQRFESIQAPHTNPAPATMAKQISAQLPHLLSKADKQTVELRLDPPELGRVTIHLTTHDQQVTAQVVAERVQTVDLMRQHVELLTATLARAGFSQADLSFQQGQSDRRESEQFQSFEATPESNATTSPPPTLTGQDGRLDIRL